MPLGRWALAVLRSIARNKKNFVFSSIGIIVGVTLFGFFMALAAGIREGVLNRVYPINQVELEPMSVSIAGFQSDVRERSVLNDALTREFLGFAGVTHVYPKQRTKLASMFKGGTAIWGHQRYFEAFFDGLAPELLRDELQLTENVAEKRRRQAGRRKIPCESTSDCKPGYECGDGSCRLIEYWRQFRDYGQSLDCKTDEQCVAGSICVGERCETACAGDADCGSGGRCVAVPGAKCSSVMPCAAELPCENGQCMTRVCALGCADDLACLPGQACIATRCTTDRECDGGPCVAGQCAFARTCRPLPCQHADAKDQDTDDWDVVQGHVPTRCAADAALTDCPPCPEGSYCAARSRARADGFCEHPVAVLMSPFLLEMYNAVAGPQMGAPRIYGEDALAGLEFRVSHGESMITYDMKAEQTIIKRCRVVGFSSKALDLGVTGPLDYVRRVNAHYKGPPAAGRYDTVILQTRGNEDVAEVTRQAELRGFGLSSKSRDAKKAGTMLFVLTLVFAFISAVIMAVAAINITHTFLMIIYERKREIGIMRAIGASRMDIRALILGEAALIGLFGGMAGNGLAYGLSRAVNWAGQRFLKGIPFKPDDFFVFDPWMLAAAVAFALFFCLVGAFFPANRAARLDPAAVLSMP